MPLLNIPINQSFICREPERQALARIARKETTPCILIVYGRRRIGKTELLEQTFRERKIIKFEGKEGQSSEVQRRHVLNEMAKLFDDPLLAKLQLDTWLDIFELIYRYTKDGEWTVYFEELQWLANYKDEFVSDLKIVWDNKFRHNPKMLVILCGSSPSFMINQVAHSKALYNRSQYEMLLEQFTLPEAAQFLKNRSRKEVMDAYLTLGGIPLYLEKLNDESSVFLSLCQNSFTKKSFFSDEYQRIFISSMSENKNYQKIIEFLSKHRYATRADILKHLKLTSGGNITALLDDLELCGFIAKYAPYNAGEHSLLIRYCIQDPYLQFYNKFIRPIQKEIATGRYAQSPQSAMNRETYSKWLGYAFERFCRRYDFVIADILRFSAVKYRSGPYFSRSSKKESPGYQIDLLFDRDDHVVTVCEIKYSINKMSRSVIEEFERKIALFNNPKKKTIQRVLITANGVENAIEAEGYFDKIITLDDLFEARY